MKKKIEINLPFAEATGYVSDATDKSFYVYGFNTEKFKKVACLRYITSNRRGQGDGNRALESFIAKCRQAGAEAIVLCYDLSERQKKGFVLKEWYEKYGFNQIGKSFFMIKKL